MENTKAILDICGKKTLEYVFECLARFNRGINSITLRAIGANISKGIEIARILQKEFGILIDKTNVESFQISYMDTPCLKIGLKLNENQRPVAPSIAGSRPAESQRLRFIEFPVYHMLLDWHLSQSKKLELFKRDEKHSYKMVTVVEEDGEMKCQIQSTTKDADERAYGGIGDALYRCGMLLTSNWLKVINKLSEFDDVILGVDTNILYDCTISEQILPLLTLTNQKGYVHTPNWVLFVVPSAVMHELEESANIRDETGFLQIEGRLGFRALQELIDLSQGTDIAGVSLVIVGEANPILDTRVEIQGLREDFWKREKPFQGFRSLRSLKRSTGDMIIRDQYKEFLRQIDFHKGTYFLTADKSSAALARTEGVHPIYLRFPTREFRENSEITPYKIETSSHEFIRMEVPIGKLIYELAVQFRNLAIKWDTKEITLHCDCKGERLDLWNRKSLLIQESDQKILEEGYQGVFALDPAMRVWNNLHEKFLGLEGF